nr:zinc finger, CCHC-type, retrotransposon Gag domain protein [Tanacetum cinerariifolium]
MVTTRNNPNVNVPNFEAVINATVANALPNLTAALRTQITNNIRNGAGPSGGGGGDAIPHGIHVWIERCQRQARHFKWGLKKQVAAAARNIVLLHESGNSNKRDRDGSSGQRRSTETLPHPPLCATCGKPHPGVCYKATRGCFTCRSTQHKSPNIENLSVVREFADVFPDEIPGLPPAREIM